MKKLFTIIFIFISVLGYSQISLDTLILNEVNEYRKSMNVKELKWDEQLQEGAEHHSTYLLYINFQTIENIATTNMCAEGQYKLDLVRGHEERAKTTGIENLSFYQRSKRYNITRENVMTILGYMDTDLAAFSIVDAWKKSPSHNETLLHSDMRFCGISTKLVKIKDIGSKFGMNMFNVYIVSTMTFK